MLRRPGPSTGSLLAATSRGAALVAHTRWLRRPPVRASIRRPCLRHRGGKRLQATTVHVAVASVWSSPGGVAPSAWVWALVGCAAALSQALEERTAWGAGLSAPAVCIGTGLALSYLGLLPVDCPVYEQIKGSLLPLGICMVLLSTRLPRRLGPMRDTMLAFGVATVGTLVGTVCAWTTLQRFITDPASWKVAAALCASYIGGSINFLATGQALQIPASLAAGAMTVDNLTMAIYICGLMCIPLERSGSPSAVARSASLARSPAPADNSAADPSGDEARGRATTEGIAASFALGLVACACGASASSALGPEFASLQLVFAAAVASLLAFTGELASFVSKGVLGFGAVLSPAFEIGRALLLPFFVVLGASAGPGALVASGSWVLLFILVSLLVHFIFVAVVGSVLKIPRQSLLIASNAAIGGPSTAVAMASARGWSNMLQPAAAVGIVGYTFATAIGIMMGALFRSI